MANGRQDHGIIALSLQEPFCRVRHELREEGIGIVRNKVRVDNYFHLLAVASPHQQGKKEERRRDSKSNQGKLCGQHLHASAHVN